MSSTTNYALYGSGFFTTDLIVPLCCRPPGHHTPTTNKYYIFLSDRSPGASYSAGSFLTSVISTPKWSEGQVRRVYVLGSPPPNWYVRSYVRPRPVAGSTTCLSPTISMLCARKRRKQPRIRSKRRRSVDVCGGRRRVCGGERSEAMATA